ncbi:homoserine O-succinyltransferase MetX [Lysobacter fragariae]
MSLDANTISSTRAEPASTWSPAFPARRGEVQTTLPLRHGGTHQVTLRFEVLGDASLPAVFIAGGISAHRHLAASAAFPEAGWWQEQVGEGRALDPTRHCLVAFDWLGCAGDLDTVIDPADQADAVAVVLDALSIDRIEAFIGASYGAMVGLQFALRHAHRVGQVVAISGTHRAHPFSSAWRALQRRAVALGAGLALARQLAILSYRTPEEFAERFGATRVVDGQVRVAAEDYLDHCGTLYASRVSPVAYARLSESIDLQALEPEDITVPVIVVGVEQDRLVPVEDSVELARRLGAPSRLYRLESIYGHDAFLKAVEDVHHLLVDALHPTVPAAAHNPIQIQIQTQIEAAA